MGAEALLDTLRSLGFTLRARDGGVGVRPASRLTPELREAIRKHKPELLQSLLRVEQKPGHQRTKTGHQSFDSTKRVPVSTDKTDRRPISPAPRRRFDRVYNEARDYHREHYFPGEMDYLSCHAPVLYRRLIDAEVAFNDAYRYCEKGLPCEAELDQAVKTFLRLTEAAEAAYRCHIAQSPEGTCWIVEERVPVESSPGGSAPPPGSRGTDLQGAVQHPHPPSDTVVLPADCRRTSTSKSARQDS